METEPNDLTFPCPATGRKEGDCSLTKREYFAAMAMQGLCSNQVFMDNASRDKSINLAERLANESVIKADALINALNK